jgi:N utilization substance protein B
MQALCSLDVQGDEFLLHVPYFLADSQQPQGVITYAQRLIETAWNNRTQTATEIGPHAPGWSIARMTPVDRNVIRTALAEFDLGEAPPKVILDEAVEIARTYGSEDSGRFVNGVLDALWKTLTGGA